MQRAAHHAWQRASSRNHVSMICLGAWPARHGISAGLRRWEMRLQASDSWATAMREGWRGACSGACP
eukprot:222083-Alexandrium_andersonii.AAC.1